ncbi:M15 family metallopeptidase [Streptomyces sp. NPDC059853]|uniref:M15 family metallopeptidase n=1 Tax=Streptomyces sp. NPDC059853 TaxID=3346973 RepID=UPI003649AA2E
MALTLIAVAVIGVVACQVVERTSGDHLTPTTRPSGSDGLDQGVLPSRATVFDADLPGIDGLAPDLRSALEQATRDARADDIEIFVNSGWRSSALQRRLLDEAVSEYGSREEAARWVASPETSAHVSGEAVDIGGMDAYLWLSERDRGAAYGLCQIYANEPWHFEYRPDALSEGCPEQYLDPTHDPNMRP